MGEKQQSFLRLLGLLIDSDMGESVRTAQGHRTAWSEEVTSHYHIYMQLRLTLELVSFNGAVDWQTQLSCQD